MSNQVQHATGAFLEAGGNRAFFVNGVLETLSKEGIRPDFLVGFSASAPIVLAHLLGKNGDVLEQFASALDANDSNFRFFRSPHFPHDGIYRHEVERIVDAYMRERPAGHFALYAAAMKDSFARTKSILISLALLAREFLHIHALSHLRSVLRMRESVVSDNSEFTAEYLNNFIMGSSSIYPFIGVYKGDGIVFAEGGILELDYSRALSHCRRKIVIHTEQGESGERDGLFHIYSSKPIPNNTLNYTSGAAVRELHRMGAQEAEAYLQDLKEYLTD